MRIFILFLAALEIMQMALLAQPVITNQPVSRVVWAGVNVTFAVGISNAESFTYQWQLNNANLINDVISTVAGNGIYDYSGDGDAATNASLKSPSGVAVDAYGNIFIADENDHRVRKVNTSGIITTVAGNGIGSYSGDGDEATNASLDDPYSVAVDSSGNLFIAEIGNQRIRKVSTNGIITTVAGNGTADYSGDGGAATNASLHWPYGVTIDSIGNLFIADLDNHRIRKVDTNGIITTVAGNGMADYSGDGGAATNASLNYPYNVAMDNDGNLFIADQYNHRIRRVDTNGIITTVAGNGTAAYAGDGNAATNASLNYPDGVALDTTGNLFISDEDNERIRKVDTSGLITTIAGNGSYGYSGDGVAATNSSFSSPTSVAMDANGNLFVADKYNNRIRKVTNTQGRALELNNVSAANAGNYQVVVTGSDGSVTSSVANLIVTASPIIYRTVPNPDGSVALYFVSKPDSTNLVLCATNLLPPVVWQPISTNMAGADGDWQFTDTNALGQMKFYQSLTH
jgi:NHL repeat